MGTMLLFIIILLLSKFAQAVISLSNGMTFDATLIGDTKIQFTITASSTGFVGFAFGTWMWTSDVFVIQASGGSGTITDRKMNGHTVPSLDVVNDYTLSTSTSGTTNTYTVTRLLNDGDSSDYQFTSGTHNIVYAWGSGSLSYHNANRGSFSITISITSSTSSSGSSSSSSSGVTTSSVGTITVDDGNTKKHGILQYVAWGWLCFFMIITGRYLKYFYFINTFLHLIFGLSILIITLVAAFSINDITKTSETESFLGKSHKSLGTALVYLMISLVCLGFINKSSMLWCRYLTIWVKIIRFIHSKMAYLVIIYSQYVILTGLYTLQASVRAIYFVQIAVILLCFAIIEIAFWLINIKFYKAIISVKKKGLKSMSIKEFFESKRKLALFNDCSVFFEPPSPGGRGVHFWIF